VVCLAPRAPGDSVRPRRLSGVVVRPLNFTVRGTCLCAVLKRGSPLSLDAMTLRSAGGVASVSAASVCALRSSAELRAGARWRCAKDLRCLRSTATQVPLTTAWSGPWCACGKAPRAQEKSVRSRRFGRACARPLKRGVRAHAGR